MSGKENLSKRLYLGKGYPGLNAVVVPDGWATPEVLKYLSTEKGHGSYSFIKYILGENKELADVTPDDIDDFATVLEEINKSSRTVDRYTNEAKQLLKLALPPEKMEKFYVSPSERASRHTRLMLKAMNNTDIPNLIDLACSYEENHLRRFLQFLKDKDASKKITELTEADLSEYQKSLEMRMYSQRTIRRLMSPAKRFIRLIKSPNDANMVPRKYTLTLPPFAELENTDNKALVRARGFFWFIYDNNFAYNQAVEAFPLYQKKLENSGIKKESVQATMSRIRKILKNTGFNAPEPGKGGRPRTRAR